MTYVLTNVSDLCYYVIGEIEKMDDSQKKPRSKKNRYSVRLSTEALRKLDELSTLHGRSGAVILEIALEIYYRDSMPQQKNQVQAHEEGGIR
ncbi:MAG: hypothetical protein AB9888_15235 [Bacteroidales bacterium]